MRWKQLGGWGPGSQKVRLSPTNQAQGKTEKTLQLLLGEKGLGMGACCFKGGPAWNLGTIGTFRSQAGGHHR